MLALVAYGIGEFECVHKGRFRAVVVERCLEVEPAPHKRKHELSLEGAVAHTGIEDALGVLGAGAAAEPLENAAGKWLVLGNVDDRLPQPGLAVPPEVQRHGAMRAAGQIDGPDGGDDALGGRVDLEPHGIAEADGLTQLANACLGGGQGGVVGYGFLGCRIASASGGGAGDCGGAHQNSLSCRSSA